MVVSNIIPLTIYLSENPYIPSFYLGDLEYGSCNGKDRAPSFFSFSFI